MNLIIDQRPDIMMIQETKMKKDFLGNIKSSNWMSGVASDLEAASGGPLTLFNYKYFRVESIINEGDILFCKIFHI